MRYFWLRIMGLSLALGLASGAKAQDILKMIDGTEKQVKLIGLAGDKVLYYELGDPLTIEKNFPKNRITKIIYEDGKVQNLRDDDDKPGIVMIKKSAPDTLREAVVLKTSEEIPCKILVVEPTEIIIRHRAGPKVGYQESIRREVIARLRYPDGSERNIAQEAKESVANYGRQVFNFYDEVGPDLFFRYHFVTKAAKSQGRLYNPDEIQSFKRFVNLRDAVEHRTDVRFLDLTNQKLTSLPHDVLTLKRLIALDISNNPLGTFPDQVLSLPNLQYLWVDSCQFDELKPKFDNKQASNLIYLSARGNKLTEFNAAVGDLPSLYFLRLDNNRIKKVKGKGLFTSGPDINSTLAIVSLNGNVLDELPSGLSAFPQIRYLGCRGNVITQTGNATEGFNKLVSLDLGQNPLQKLDNAVLKIPDLEALQLDNTYLVRLPQQGWAGAKKLHWLTLPTSAVPLPDELWRTPSLARFSVVGKPTPETKAVEIPALLPDSLSEADFSGLVGGHKLALALKAKHPSIKVRYYQPLMGKVQESGLEGPSDLALYPQVAQGKEDAALQMGKTLARVGDYGLALTALAAGAKADTVASDSLRTEQARILTLPAVQDLLAEKYAIRSYVSVTDATDNLPRCAAFKMWTGLCHTATGPAPHTACARAAAIQKLAAESLEKLASEGNAKLADRLREYAAQLKALAEATEKL